MVFPLPKFGGSQQYCHHVWNFFYISCILYLAYSQNLICEIYVYVKCKMYICIGILKHWRLSLVQVRNVYWLFLTFSFSTRGARETQFLLFWLFHLTQQCAAHPVVPTGLASPSFKNQLASSRVRSQLCFFFQNHQESQPIASGHDVIRTPIHISYLEFLLWHLWLLHPLHASVNTCAQCVYLHVH